MRSARHPLLAGALALAACAPVIPAGPAATARPAPVVVSEQPEPGPVRPFVLPPVEDFRLDNGMRVVALRQSSVPIVTARLIVDAGAEHEPAHLGGLAAVAANLLREGTGDVSGAEFAARMERLGAEFQTAAGHNLTFVGVTSLRPAVGEALGLAARAVSAPTLSDGDFQRVRQHAATAYVQRQATVEGLADEAFARAVFTPAAPYSRPAAGTAATLAAITRDDVARWHRTMFVPGNATLLLVGDLAPGDARRLAEEAFGGWRGGSARPPRPSNPARPVTGTRVILVDRPGSVQSAIRVGQASIGADDPDYLRVQALAHVLGGAFNARINQNLRERHGWTYGAWAAFVPQRGAGTVFITSSVRTTATDSALVESVREYARIVEEPVPVEELAGAAGNLAGSFPASVLTVQGLATRIQSLLVWELPLDFWSGYAPELAALTPEDLAQVGAAHLRPRALTIVVAGDLATIEAPVRALGLGEVEVWDAGGARVR